LDLKELKEILQILDEKEITEFELEEQGMKLRIRKSGAGASNHTGPSVVVAPVAPGILPSLPSLPSVAGAAAPPVSSASAASAVAEAPAAAEAATDLTTVKSPIVGTFYRAPDPNSPSFVNVGDHIRVGQVLCIIEAMKLMNEIEAELAGEVVKVHPDNGQPVQYGDPLFTIRPDR
jgi:acetyl-CoA carboxylase biotin carboxyl carrier protein